MTSDDSNDEASRPGSESGASPGAQGRVFFSYARSDAEFVLKIASSLRVDGVELWVDQLDIPKGARWDQSVEGALKGCSCLVVVLSPASVNSFNVLDEVYYTLGEEKRVVPILLHPCEIPFRLKRIQYIDFTAGYQQGYGELLATLAKRSAPRTPPHAAPPPLPPPPPAVPEPVIDSMGAGAAVRGWNEAGPGRRGGKWRHVALGGALMFFFLLIVGLVSESGKVEPEHKTSQQDPAPAVESPTAGPVQANPGGEAAAGTPPAPAPSSGGAASDTGPANTSEPSTTQAQADPVPPAVPDAPPAPALQLINIDDLQLFPIRFVIAHNRRDIGQILALYDDGVDYLDVGRGAQFVARDKQDLYRAWPNIRFELSSEIEHEFAENGQVAYLAFTVDITASNAETERQGRVREVLQLRKVGGVMKITAERQTVPP